MILKVQYMVKDLLLFGLTVCVEIVGSRHRSNRFDLGKSFKWILMILARWKFLLYVSAHRKINISQSILLPTRFHHSREYPFSWYYQNMYLTDERPTVRRKNINVDSFYNDIRKIPFNVLSSSSFTFHIKKNYLSTSVYCQRTSFSNIIDKKIFTIYFIM